MATELTTNLLRLGEFIEAKARDGISIHITPFIPPGRDYGEYGVTLIWGAEHVDDVAPTLAGALDGALKEAGH